MSWHPEQVERLKALRAEGWTAGSIAVELGVSRNAVLGKLMRLGIPCPPALARYSRATRARTRVRVRPIRRDASVWSAEATIAYRVARRPSKADLIRKGKARAEKHRQVVASLDLPTEGTRRFLDPRPFGACAFPMWADDIDWRVPGALDGAMICGRDCSSPGERYCHAHLRLMYQPPERKTRRAA